jgi:protein-S-isoprenylcysteine O-methyltransferase Ste14
LIFTLPATPIHWALVASSAATLVFFAVGLTTYFERAPRPPWVLTIHYVALLFSLLQVSAVFVLEPRAEPYVAAAIVMYVGSILLFLSAIEAAKRTRLQRSFIDLPLPDRLITDGPFRWVRHPFCAGYLMGAIAGPLGIAHPVMMVIAVPLIVITLAAAIREERVWLSGGRADEYREYRRKTGMFVPFIGRG